MSGSPASSPVKRSDEADQAAVRAWFDRTYAKRGLAYLRPATAYPIFLHLLDARPGARLLDVGCGPGLLLEPAIARGLAATGVDISSVAVAMARRRVPEATVVVGNAEALCFDAGAFDLVTCIGSLERMFDRPRVLREVQRVATDDARFCFMVRNSASLSWRFWRRGMRRQNHAAHQDAATLVEWTELFSTHGFRIDSVHPDQWFRQRVRRLWRGAPPSSRSDHVLRPLLPLRYALEFIFLLRKDTGSR